MTRVPDWWQALILAAAAFRFWRLLAWDEITEPARLRLVRYGAPAKQYRATLALFIQCAWCLGFWVTLAWWAAWLLWPHAALIAATPFALSAAVGVLAHFTQPAD